MKATLFEKFRKILKHVLFYVGLNCILCDTYINLLRYRTQDALQSQTLMFTIKCYSYFITH